MSVCAVSTGLCCASCVYMYMQMSAHYLYQLGGWGLLFQSAMFTSIYIELQQQERSRCREIGLLSVTNILLGD